MREDQTIEARPDDVWGFERFAASLIVVSGGARDEHPVDRPRWLLGRGPGVDIAFDDPEMSQRHAAIEFLRGRFHVTDLESTNGTHVNGTAVRSCELAHGDRIRLGALVFQILIERRETPLELAGRLANQAGPVLTDRQAS